MRIKHNAIVTTIKRPSRPLSPDESLAVAMGFIADVSFTESRIVVLHEPNRRKYLKAWDAAWKRSGVLEKQATLDMPGTIAFTNEESL